MKRTEPYDFGTLTTTIGKKTLARSIRLPVQECLSHPWRDFERLISDCWHHATCLSNWAAHMLRLHDVVRTPKMEALPPLAKIDLYALAFGRAKEGVGREFWQCSKCKRKWHYSQTDQGKAPDHERGKERCEGSGLPTARLARAILPAVEPLYESMEFWEGAKQSAASIIRKVERKYAQERGKIVWRRERHSPEFTFPQPFPIHKNSWVPLFSEQNQPLIQLALPGGRVSLRLRGGPEFKNAVKVFREMAEEAMSHSELVLEAQSSHAHCRLVHAKRPGDEPALELRLMARLAYGMEVSERFDTGKTAILTTGSAPFLKLEIPGDDRAFVSHAPWVQQWIAEHRQFLDRFADDLKYEKRWPKRARKRRNRRQSRGCEKHDRRMKSFRQQVAHQVVAHAKRRGCDRIVLDDRDRSFAEEFPWFLLAESLQNKCDEMGLVLDTTSAKAVNGKREEEATEEKNGK